MRNTPGKSHRQGLTLLDLALMFPNEPSARRWFERLVWNGHRCCGHCGSLKTALVPHEKPMPYWCSDCRSYFSVRTGTALERSKVPLRKWAFAVYLEITSLKSVSSMKLHRDIGVTQSTAWFMLHRIREAWHNLQGQTFTGPVEVDETYMGGKERNKHSRQKLHAGRGTVGKSTVIGAKDRETNRVTARAEQIIMKLREAEVGLAQGQRVGQVSKQMGVSEQTYYRWRKEYGGLRLDQAKRLKVLEKENTRLKKLVADLSLDKQILEEVSSGNF